MRKSKNKDYLTRKQLMKKSNKLEHELQDLKNQHEELQLKHQGSIKDLGTLNRQVRSLSNKVRLGELKSEGIKGGIISRHLMKVGL